MVNFKEIIVFFSPSHILAQSEENNKTSKRGGLLMTANQIAYWNYVENQRANRAKERETQRSNVERETETNRSNLANEDIAREKNRLSQQANMINYSYQNRSLAEQERSNRANESLKAAGNTLGYAQLESQRSIAQMQSSLGYANLGATYASLSETQRSNIQRELENTRHNKESEYMANRTVSVNRLNASAANRRAALEEQKWNDPISKQTRQQELSNLKTKQYTDSLNAAANLTSSTSRLISSLGQVITGGLKLQ